MDREAQSGRLNRPCQSSSDFRRPSRGPRRQKKFPSRAKCTFLVSALAASSLPATLAQSCIPLVDSTACPAFRNASFSTNKALVGLFPFLAFVSDTKSFDDGIRQYIEKDYARSKYQEQIGCSSVNLTNTTSLYARYTTTVLCNAIVQNSIQPCGLSNDNSRPLCADSCAEFALSEQEITASPELCGTSGPSANDKIRADFIECSLPPGALQQSCVVAVANEPDNCGYESNVQGLCSFCASSSPNSTDSCCVNSDVEGRCQNVHLPTTTSMPPLFPSATASHAPTTDSGKHHGLSGGQIAGIVVGSVLGAALILAGIIFFCLHLRKRRDAHHPNLLNTPSPTRQTMNVGPRPPMSMDGSTPTTILPGARVARMSALEGSTSSPSDAHSSRAGGRLGAYHHDHSAYDSPLSARSGGFSGADFPKRDGSLGSAGHSPIRGRAGTATGHSSPLSGSDDRNFSSPEGIASGQSEQLQFFKDYYSQDDIHPSDTVATLWAYQPRANDEFELERGDMLKVVGIWDDGWATGVKLGEGVEEWETRRGVQRDSGVSNGGGARPSTALGENEIKAFPLVCVCLPQHWRKTIEGDSTGSGPPSP
ncbi:hypothetical protein GQ43DRAFT_185052 [Delitschia confertaspora ATCC 74209]|uniref:SH3 domain-containing protein n=1 Tax=Delitschia confertaspora ATCC 74209 TaxID=1513339 RepID=A0A9P4MM55_9PLEO|nr:hypothetical protein GQ43DRAFT_185052 [Delitschia confertaspora ATCC 74209]